MNRRRFTTSTLKKTAFSYTTKSTNGAYIIPYKNEISDFVKINYTDGTSEVTTANIVDLSSHSQGTKFSYFEFLNAKEMLEIAGNRISAAGTITNAEASEFAVINTGENNNEYISNVNFENVDFTDFANINYIKLEGNYTPNQINFGSNVPQIEILDLRSNYNLINTDFNIIEASGLRDVVINNNSQIIDNPNADLDFTLMPNIESISISSPLEWQNIIIPEFYASNQLVLDKVITNTLFVNKDNLQRLYTISTQFTSIQDVGFNTLTHYIFDRCNASNTVLIDFTSATALTYLKGRFSKGFEITLPNPAILQYVILDNSTADVLNIAECTGIKELNLFIAGNERDTLTAESLKDFNFMTNLEKIWIRNNTPISLNNCNSLTYAYLNRYTGSNDLPSSVTRYYITLQDAITELPEVAGLNLLYLGIYNASISTTTQLRNLLTYLLNNCNPCPLLLEIGTTLENAVATELQDLTNAGFNITIR